MNERREKRGERREAKSADSNDIEQNAPIDQGMINMLIRFLDSRFSFASFVILRVLCVPAFGF